MMKIVIEHDEAGYVVRWKAHKKIVHFGNQALAAMGVEYEEVEKFSAFDRLTDALDWARKLLE